jgi:hypothetical protein
MEKKEGVTSAGRRLIGGSPASRRLAYVCRHRDFRRNAAPARLIGGRKLTSPSLDRRAKADLSRVLSSRTSLRIELRGG